MKTVTTPAPLRQQSGVIGISIVTGSVFALYLFLAVIAIPAGIDHPEQHYENGNTLVGDVFLSYAILTGPLSPLVAMAMYSAYTYIALIRRRRMGLILSAVHYGFAFAVAVPFHLHRFPGLAEESSLQVAKLMARPGLMAFCFMPFIVANLWYLGRLLSASRNDHQEATNSLSN